MALESVGQMTYYGLIAHFDQPCVKLMSPEHPQIAYEGELAQMLGKYTLRLAGLRTKRHKHDNGSVQMYQYFPI